MATWQYRIQRYDAKACESRLSRVEHLQADDFNAATAAVNLVARGMRSADPEREYRVVHLLSHDYRGKECDGVRLFETAEEYEARHAAEQKEAAK